MSILEGSSILVTGGTGSFGKAFIGYALENLNPERIVVFSRDELKQYEARQLFEDDARLRWFIGDIRDQHRLKRAMHGVDLISDAGEYGDTGGADVLLKPAHPQSAGHEGDLVTLGKEPFAKGQAPHDVTGALVRGSVGTQKDSH